MSASADVLYDLKMSLQFLYVVSVGLKSCVDNYGTKTEMNLQYIRMCYYRTVCTVHDTENLTFSEEFRGCSAWNDADFPHGCRGTSARAGADLLRRRAGIFRADSV